VEAPPVEPVNENRMTEYVALKDSLLGELQKIRWDVEALAGTIPD
jgi:hypothetical protein